MTGVTVAGSARGRKKGGRSEEGEWEYRRDTAAYADADAPETFFLALGVYYE